MTPMSQGCVGTACALDVSRIRTIERSAGCGPLDTPDFATWSCTGQWGYVRPSGLICTITSLPTGAIRFAVSCGACVTIVTY
jgi:hypothetical protein